MATKASEASTSYSALPKPPPPPPPVFDLTTLVGTNGFRFDGIDFSEFNGEALSSAGDINNDGFTDILIGAPNLPNGTIGSQGHAYVVLGGEQFPPVLSAADLDGLNGFKIIAGPDAPRLGTAVSSIGDVNGDGIDDYGISAPSADFAGLSHPGRVYALFGRQSLGNSNPVFDPIIDLANLDALTGMILYGAPNDRAGEIMSPTGDINGDGFVDFTISAINTSHIYFVFGNLNSLPPLPGEPARTFDLTTLDGTNGFSIDGVIGEALVNGNGGGDTNGDGRSDAIVAAPNEGRVGETNVGAAYVIFGTDSSHDWPASFDLTSLDGSNGFRILGAAESDLFGFPIDNRSDLDGDGFDDIIGAYSVLPPLPTGDPNDPPLPPTVYQFIAGSNLSFSDTIDLKNLDPSLGNQIEASPITSSMGAGGDVNGDGADDFILGAGLDGPAHVVFGGDF
ncbi:MAG: integrin alpha [Alphaproteobacteria bacterium]|nr:integrin alpha [Alphaproteobacteria bacterium]